MSFEDMLLVSEIFGPTIQGEGRNAGAPAVFVRTAYCNVHCSWCDTAYSWDWRAFRPSEQVAGLHPTEVWRQAQQLNPGGANRLVITGGEPALQWTAVSTLATMAVAAGWSVELETSGTRSLGAGAELFEVITVSPKLRNADVAESRRELHDSVAAIACQANVVAKFVVADQADIDEVRTIVERYGFAEVYLMPLAQTPEELARGMAELVDPAARLGYRVSPRLQVLCWPGQRAH